MTANGTQENDASVRIHEADGGVTVDLSGPCEVVPENGRVYYEEHFAHGVRLAPLEEKLPPSRKATGAILRALTSKNLDAGYKTVGQVNLGTPMPKWPAGHQSALFESIVPKKSYILSPPEIYAECAHHGEEKSKYAWYKIWTLTIIAGCYVGFGYSVCMLVGGNLVQAPGVGQPAQENYGLYKLVFGAVGFPFGFTAIIVCGADLYTSLCAYMTAAWWEGKVSILDTIRMLSISWVGNFIGCALMAGLFKASEVYNHHDITLLRTANDKVSHGWGATLVKGIFANWLVGIATWQANAAQDLTGKFVGIWLPISAFAMIGFEHCIANMFVFVMAWCQGAHITAEQFIWRNLIPATLGNYIGGAVCLATVYAIAYGSPPKKLGAWVDSKMKRS